MQFTDLHYDLARRSYRATVAVNLDGRTIAVPARVPFLQNLDFGRLSLLLAQTARRRAEAQFA